MHGVYFWDCKYCHLVAQQNADFKNLNEYMLPSKVNFDSGSKIKLNSAVIKCLLLREVYQVCNLRTRQSPPTSQEAISQELIPVCKEASIISTPPLHGMLVHCRVSPSIKFAGTHLYTWVEEGTERGNYKLSVLPRNTLQCPQLGLTPRALNLKMSALNMKPLRATGIDVPR